MSAAVAVSDALVAALMGDATLTALTSATAEDGRVYDGRAPEGTSLRNSNGTARPYIVVGQATEGAAHQFGRRGQDGATRLHGWVPGAAPRAAKALYVHLARILDGQRLPLAGHTMVVGTLRLVTTVVEQDNSATQCVAEYRVLSLVGA